jgi:hypothetical protein
MIRTFRISCSSLRGVMIGNSCPIEKLEGTLRDIDDALPWARPDDRQRRILGTAQARRKIRRSRFDTET